MRSHEIQSIKNYLYIDEQGIDSIFSQLCDETTNEMTVKQTKSNNGKIGFNGGISTLKKLFNADATINGEHTNTSEIEKTVSLSYEQKIHKIIKIISESDYYYTNLNEAIKKYNSIEHTVFINTFDTFFSRLDFSSYDTFQYIQECQYLEFEKGDMPISQSTNISYNTPYDNYNYDDNYFKDSRIRVVFSMRLEKLRTPYFSPSSHLGTALRLCDGKMQFGIWGQL